MIEKIFGSWKTTLLGLATAYFAWVASSPDIFHNWPALLSFAKFVAIGGAAGLGMGGQDPGRGRQQ